MTQTVEELLRSVEGTAAWLKGIDDTSARRRPITDKWSVQEILGHLIDSAANNHQRFVRAQHVDPLVLPAYGADEWVGAQNYLSAPWAELIDLWLLYNRHLARVMRGVPKSRWKTECRIGANAPVTLQWVMGDYVRHLQHHIQQMRERAALVLQQ